MTKAEFLEQRQLRLKRDSGIQLKPTEELRLLQILIKKNAKKMN